MRKTMLERLLGHLHRAVFDTTADEVVAFYLDGPAGSRWVAANEFFDITFADGSTLHYDLNNFTMAQFSRQLAADGMTVSRFNDATMNFAGITMLELEGEAGKNNPIVLYKDILHSIFGAYSREIRSAQDNVKESFKELNIQTANDGFLDEWGDMFGVPRDTRTDDEYGVYIPAEAFRLRVNSIAIEKAVKDITGYDITLSEPWRDVFMLDISQLSGMNRFYDGKTASYFQVQPVAFKSVNWDVIMPVIRRNLAAGIELLNPLYEYIYFVNQPLAGNVWVSQWSMMAEWVKTDHLPRLDTNIRLSKDYQDDFNFPVAISLDQHIHTLNDGLIGTVWNSPSRILSRNVEWGDIPVLNEYWAFGATQFNQLYSGEPRTWSDGVWDLDATWILPYDWKAYFRFSTEVGLRVVDATDYMHNFWLEATDGDSWETVPSWDTQNNWTHGMITSIAVTKPFYIKVMMSDPMQSGELREVDNPPVPENQRYNIEHAKDSGAFNVTLQLIDLDTDKPVSGGMVKVVMANSQPQFAMVTQLANKYTFTITPLSNTGNAYTDITFTHPDHPELKTTVEVIIL
ncbi:hypothetical protein MF451_003701 [Salmonella enterica subsp. enterica serovar Saintpaul]|nr:hypothetical protein [Salmonella enterica subsp. enterica serovar Saintpaul]